MRILVVGAGSVGGYFGGRLLKAGRDVTFLVRPARAEVLARTGLVIKSANGDAHITDVPTITADAISSSYDVVLLSCKSYDLDSAMAAFAPAVGPNTRIMPMLNGMRHLDALDGRFGADKVLGGWCAISAALGEDGQVLHLNRLHGLSFGERDGSHTPEVLAIESAFRDAGFDSARVDAIVQEMWDKWVLIATGAGSTCLMRGTIGDIVSANAQFIVHALLAECGAIATRNGFAPPRELLERLEVMFTAAGSPLTASMFRDMEAGARIEGDHIIGDLIVRGGPDHLAYPTLRVVHAHLRTYEERRSRELTASAS